MDLTWVLGVENCFAGLIMLWAALRITTNFGFSTAAQRWALFRRILYLTMSVAMVAIGLERVSGKGVNPAVEFVSHNILLFGLVVFPMLRATNFISQDSFIAFFGPWPRRRLPPSH